MQISHLTEPVSSVRRSQIAGADRRQRDANPAGARVTSSPPSRVFPRLRIGVSACLLGELVRYDGGHKRDGLVTGQLADFVDFVALCPEVGIGMGVPRPPIRLVGDPQSPQAVRRDDPTFDVTTQLESYARKQLASLGDISGYILKKDSPSCGMQGVKLYGPEGGPAQPKGVGIFARTLMEAIPLLPVEDEERLADPTRRDSFLTRIYTYRRWQELRAHGITPGRLIELHSDHKYLVMAHSQAAYRRMGHRLANLSGADMDVVASTYIAELMTALERRAGCKRHTNVLQHILGHFKRRIDGSEKSELVESIDAYRRGKLSLTAPIVRLRHCLERHPDPYLERQHYLYPYPDALSLHSNSRR